MKPEDKIRSLIDKSDARTDRKTDQRILGDALEHMEMTAQKDPAPSRSKIWRTIMKGKTAKLAAAAVILIGLIVLTSVLVETSESVLLAGVLERIEQARAFRYKMAMTMTETTNPERAKIHKIEGTIVVSSEYGTKYEMRTSRQIDAGTPNSDPGRATTKLRYILPRQKLDVLIKPEQKSYLRTQLDDDSLSRMKRQDDDPREMIRRILACEYTNLGRSHVDGAEVEGFETTDPKWEIGTTNTFEDLRVKLWVDVKTLLPVRCETETTINEHTSLHTVFCDFQWDIPVTASDFEPVIPADYTSMVDHYHELPGWFEEAALKRLREFAEIFGRYPEKLDIDQESIARELSSLGTSENLTDTGLRLKEEMKSLDPAQSAQRAMDMSQVFQSISIFYKELVNVGRDPAYYGDKVSAGSPDAVLMRWKIRDGRHRVVFGDLSARDVTPEELAELEKP